ncbi:MAG: DMT family transporter [Anaerolineales bacterium]|nr:DMT family transporter [Anaerolineales bacterium]
MNKFLPIVVVLLVVDSFHFVFARLLLPFLPPMASSFYYMAIAMLLIALYAGVRRQINWHVFRDNAQFFILIGFLIAIATSISFTAVSYIDPGTASMVARMGTVFALGFSIFWLKERLVRGQQIGAVVAVIGVFVISFQLGDTTGVLWLGTLLVLIANFSYALHAAIVKKNGQEIDFTNFLLFRMVTSVLFLFVFAVGRGEMVWPAGQQVWWILLVTAVVNVIISRSLYYMSLRHFNLSFLTILLTLTPVLTILWSILLFGERPSLQGFLGGTAVIVGVFLVNKSKNNLN